MDAATDTQQRDALTEGRRIYLGNLLYSVKPSDVDDLLRQTGFDQLFEKLHISVDPVSGRNPGYCFLEFATREEADRALSSLPGTLLFNRPVKVGPCHPKAPAQSRWGRDAGYNPTFQRWGDWNGSERNGDEQPQQREPEQGPHAAMRHLESRSHRPRDKAQLYIGGLTKMTNQEHHDAEMQELLAGFDYVAIGKRITPRAETRSVPGNYHYCFVDFSSADEAERALNALHGKPVEGGALRVSFPRSKGPASEPTGTNHGWRSSPANAGLESGSPATGRRQEGEEGQDAQERRKQQSERQKTIMASRNWRVGASAN